MISMKALLNSYRSAFEARTAAAEAEVALLRSLLTH